MKKSNVIGFASAALVLAAFLLVPAITLDLAKRTVARKFSASDFRILNCVPSPSILTIPHLDPAATYLVVAPHGYEAGLPDSEFQRDITHKAMFTNDNLSVAFFGTLDKTNYSSFEHELGLANTFEAVSNAYCATITGISEQRSLTQLRRYTALIQYKAAVAPAGFDHSWLQFNRGDFNGLISGDFPKDGRVVVEIYLKERDEFLTMLIKRTGKAGDMSDVYHVLSVMRLKPSPQH